MTEHDDRDERIEELFFAARRADEASAPGFRRLLQRTRPGGKPRRLSRFGVRPAFAIAAASFAVVAFAYWLGVHEPRPVGPAGQITLAEADPGSDRPVGDPPRLDAKSEPLLHSLGYVANGGEDSTSKETNRPAPKARPMPKPAPPPALYRKSAKPDAGYNAEVGRGEAPRPYAGGELAARIRPGAEGRASLDAAAVQRALELVVDDPAFSTEGYALIGENDFLAARDNPLSTFSIDVDTASYTNVRRFLSQGRVPPRDAVRVEELINYFRYDYPLPDGDAPFSASVEVAGCPWNAEHRLARIGLRGREVSRHDYRGSNLVFLLDVSGSMQPPNKLPLLKSALAMLVDQLDGRDQVAVVVYAGSSGLVLPSTSGDAKSEILDALDNLQAGGSTNGGEGLRLAYRVARENFIRGGVNRVILATDGDFNVGVTGKSELLGVIEKDAREGIFLTALGFGTGNYKDDTLEMLADRGNGNYAYIDSLKEARRVLVEEIGGTLVTIAKDVKIQVEFNPLEVGAYRLIGYENRKLNKEDFNDDRKDAGEIGAGHTVTALYEIVPPEAARSVASVDPLKYQQPGESSRAARSGELFTLKLRYKRPDEEESRLLDFPVTDEGLGVDQASADFKFAASVAMFGMILRDSEHRGSATLDRAARLSLEGMQRDARGLRAEFHDLVGRAIDALAEERSE